MLAPPRRALPAVLALSASLSATAATPVIDWKSIYETYKQTQAQIEMHVQEIEQHINGVLSNITGQEELANATQEAALTDAALRRQDTQEIHNLGVAERAVPDRDVCRNLHHSEQFRSAAATAAAQRRTTTVTQGNLHRAAMFGDRNAADQARDNRTQIDQIVGWCAASETGACVDPTVLTETAAVGGARAEERRVAANLQVQLLTGVQAVPKPRAVDVQSADSRVLAVDVLRREAVRSLAAASLAAVAAETTPGPDGAPPPMAAYQAFVAERFGSPAAERWLLEVANAGDAGSEDVMPAEVLRKVAVLTGFSAHMDVEFYRQMLRIEALTAALVALEAEPLE